MIKKIIDIISAILSFFFNKKKEEKKELINKIEEAKIEEDFKSSVEETAKRAESDNQEEKAKAIEDMRKLIS